MSRAAPLPLPIFLFSCAQSPYAVRVRGTRRLHGGGGRVDPPSRRVRACGQKPQQRRTRGPLGAGRARGQQLRWLWRPNWGFQRGPQGLTGWDHRICPLMSAVEPCGEGPAGRREAEARSRPSLTSGRGVAQAPFGNAVGAPGQLSSSGQALAPGLGARLHGAGLLPLSHRPGAATYSESKPGPGRQEELGPWPPRYHTGPRPAPLPRPRHNTPAQAC